MDISNRASLQQVFGLLLLHCLSAKFRANNGCGHIINAKDSDKSAIYYSHYDGINKDEILELKEYTEHNLKIVKSHSDSWKKYFDIEVCRKYQKILDMLIKEHCIDPSYTGEMYAEKVKELMNQEL